MSEALQIYAVTTLCGNCEYELIMFAPGQSGSPDIPEGVWIHRPDYSTTCPD